MLIIIGFVVVACIVVYKRSTEIIVVNPMRFTPPNSAESSQSIDFGRILNTIQDAAAEALEESQHARLPSSDKGRAAIRNMVKNHQFVQAIQRYSQVYGVDLRTAKKAVDEMMLEG